MQSQAAAGNRWDARPLGRRASAFLTAAAVTTMAMTAATPTQSEELVGVIVRATSGAVEQARAAALSLGGTIERDLGIINGFSGDLPADAVASLEANVAVDWVSPDDAVRMQSTLTTSTGVVTDDGLVYTTTTDLDIEPVLTVATPVPMPLPVLELPSPGNLDLVAKTIQADRLHARGVTGAGIDVALIDSGVVPVAGLDGANVVHGPDLSFEGGYAPVTHLDTFGHGTHMAGIIAANGGETDGIAPDARIVSVKVADATGATDVSQVIAGIDWVVQNKNTDGRNIRVLNLSFGTDGAQGYRVDPLTYAAEVAWKNGIVVVASAGNHGADLGRLANPAIDPFIIAVGATDTLGTPDPTDDQIPSWSAKGNRDREPDVAAPGRSIESMRSPGSWIDTNNPTARLGDTLFKGSGTSQAAAVTSGAVALLLSANPSLTPDQVKAMLRSSAVRPAGSQPYTVGSGTIQLDDASRVSLSAGRARQKFHESDGSGSLEAARGSHHVEIDGVILTGEVTANGSNWNGSTWAGSTWAGSNWNGANWNGSTWAGSTWAGSTWAGSTWAGSTWAGSTWAGSTWAGSTWAGSTWASTSFWSGVRWN